MFKTLKANWVVSKSEIAATLVSKFFSPLSAYFTPENNTSYSQLGAKAITEKNIKNTIFKVSSLKSRINDRVPALI